jgi:hypothetical protein
MKFDRARPGMGWGPGSRDAQSRARPLGADRPRPGTAALALALALGLALALAGCLHSRLVPVRQARPSPTMAGSAADTGTLAADGC